MPLKENAYTPAKLQLFLYKNFSFHTLFIYSNTMSTFPSPVSLAEFQNYLKDTTVDIGILAFYQTLLDTATEKIYTYLDRDYTPSVAKTDVFFGRGLHVHKMRNPAGALVSWKYYDNTGAETIANIADLVLLANGSVTVCAVKTFLRGFEHRLKYFQPTTLTCPETVKQVITETAAIIFEESKQGSGRLGIMTESDRLDTNTNRVRYLDLTERQKATLMPYKRYAI